MSLKWSQGSEYNEEHVEGEEEASPRPKLELKKFGIIAGGTIGVALAIAFVFWPRSPKEEVDPPVEEDPFAGVVWEPIPQAFSYTDAERTALQDAGYTQDEITVFEDAELNVSTLTSAAARIAAEAEASYPLPDTPEYQALIDMTWFGQQDIDFVDIDTTQILYGQNKWNADYEKVPAHGHDLFLKVYLEDGSATFMRCSVDRYLSLPDSGNIVVTYSSQYMNGYEIITSISEVEVS